MKLALCAADKNSRQSCDSEAVALSEFRDSGWDRFIDSPGPGARRSNMLVLTRKVDQGIVIAGNIYIRVLGVERDRVKIGIAAPKEIPVLREELLDRDRDNAKADTNSTGPNHDDSHSVAAVDSSSES